MAIETYANSGDVRTVERLAAEFRLVLADRFSLFGHPSLVYGGNAGETGSSVVKIPIVSLGGVNRLVAIGAGGSTTPTSITKTSVSCTVARQALERGQEDLNEMVDSIGFNIEAMVMDGVAAYAMRWMEMLCNVADDFASTIGTTTVDMDADDWFSGWFTLIQNSVPGPFLWNAFPVQFTDFLNSLRAEAGAIQFRSDTQDIFSASGQGVMGTFLGATISTSSLVPTATAGADSASGMWGPGAIGWCNGLPNPIRGSNEVVFPAGQQLFTEIERDARAATTKIVHNAYLGFVLMEERGITFVTDR